MSLHAGLLLASISQSSPSKPPSSRLRHAMAPCIPYTLSPVALVPEKIRLMGMPRHVDKISHTMKERLQTGVDAVHV